MRIAVYSEAFLPSLGGCEIMSDLLARALTECGHKVLVVTATPAEPSFDVGLPYRVIRRPDAMTILRAYSDRDLVVCKRGVCIKGCWPAALLAKRLVTVHESGSPYWKGPTRGVRSWLKAAIRHALVAYARGQVGVTSAAMKANTGPLSRRVWTVYNAVSPELAECIRRERNERCGAQRAEYDVLYVGRIVKEKGVVVLADALRLADRSGLALRACFVGEGDATAPLRDIASHLHHVTVDFPGRLGGPSLARAYCASAVTVLPTLPDSPGSQFTLEGMGLVLAESFFAGLPVVASDLPTIREVVGDGGLLFTPGDPVELCEKLRRLVTDAGLYGSLAARASVRANTFLYETYKVRINEVLSILSGCSWKNRTPARTS